MEEQKISGKCVLSGSYGESFLENKKKCVAVERNLENE